MASYQTQDSYIRDIQTFKGLNRTLRGGNGEFLDMLNLSSDAYPCIKTRAPRKVIMEGIINPRLLIEPINKDLSDEIPKFTGICDEEENSTESTFYYNGKPVGRSLEDFSQGYEHSFTDGRRIIYDSRVLFPKGKGTQISYQTFNDRIFIFVNNKNDFAGYSKLTLGNDGDGSFSNERHTVKIKERITDEMADALLYRNVRLYTFHNGDYTLKRYIVGVNKDDNTVTFNAPVYENMYGFGAHATFEGATMTPIYDAEKYYFDAPKEDAVLHNAEKGIYNKAVGIIPYDAHLINGITYTNPAMVYCKEDIFSKAFKVGDSVKLEGFRITENNTVIADSNYEETSSDTHYAATVIGIFLSGVQYQMWLQLTNADGAVITCKEELLVNEDELTSLYNPFISISHRIPAMNSVIAHDQRLWGTAKNGQYIYASRPSDPFSWNVTGEGEADALMIASATKNEYTGIRDFGQYILFLKPTSLQQMYALTSASSIQLARAITQSGCIDINSAVVIGGMLYYLSYDGFCAYGGGQVERIGDKLNKKYKSANAFTDGRKYYASAKSISDEEEFLVFDTQRGYWYKEDNINVIGAYSWYDKTIALTADGKIYLIGADGEEKDIEWYFETPLLFESTLDQKALNEVWVRAYVPKGKKITVYHKSNHSHYREVGEFVGAGDIKVWHVTIPPINAEWNQIKLRGEGEAVVYDMEYTYAKIEGRQYYRGER